MIEVCVEISINLNAIAVVTPLVNVSIFIGVDIATENQAIWIKNGEAGCQFVSLQLNLSFSDISLGRTVVFNVFLSWAVL